MDDLGFYREEKFLNVLSLSTPPVATRAGSRKRGLWMGAKSASVSYKREINADTLAEILASGHVPPPFIAHIVAFLDEVPISVIVMAVEEAASRANVSPKTVWQNVRCLATELDVHRKEEFS